jgi:hypothetical protein
MRSLEAMMFGESFLEKEECELTFKEGRISKWREVRGA